MPFWGFPSSWASLSPARSPFRILFTDETPWLVQALVSVEKGEKKKKEKKKKTKLCIQSLSLEIPRSNVTNQLGLHKWETENMKTRFDAMHAGSLSAHRTMCYVESGRWNVEDEKKKILNARCPWLSKLWTP